MKWQKQFVRYGVVGFASNVVGFLFYLVLTYAGVGHITAMTVLFAIGILQTFIFNKRWTFNHSGSMHSSFAKYLFVYLAAYLLNLVALLLFVDYWGLPHQIIQGVMIFSLAFMLFLLQKYWVFRPPETDHRDLPALSSPVTRRPLTLRVQYG